MKLFLLFLIFSIGLEQPLIVSNDGVGEISIGVSTLADVKDVFKNGNRIKKKKRIQQISMLTSDHRCIVSKKVVPKMILYRSEKDGYQFTFQGNTVSQIELWIPMKAKTDSGIELGKSNFKELDSLYGKSTPFSYHSRIAKRYDNFIFLSAENDLSNSTDSIVIDKIIIYKE